MFETSADLLNLSLAVGFAILVVFASIFLFYATMVLRDVGRVTHDVEEIVGKVRSSIIEPLKAVDFIIEKAKPYIEAVLERRVSATKSRKSSK